MTETDAKRTGTGLLLTMLLVVALGIGYARADFLI
jgi:hypothetical protein